MHFELKYSASKVNWQVLLFETIIVGLIVNMVKIGQLSFAIQIDLGDVEGLLTFLLLAKGEVVPVV